MNNIIIDGNYLFYKTLFIFRPEGGKKVMEPKRQQEDFIRKVATDMAFAIRQFGSPSRVIFTIDGRSWRKDVEIEENQGYKAHRTKESNIDWDSFFKCMNILISVLHQSKLQRAVRAYSITSQLIHTKLSAFRLDKIDKAYILSLN